MEIRREEGTRAEQKPEQKAGSDKQAGQGTKKGIGCNYAKICELHKIIF
jgi:hypothetical protein